ncbi:Hypothetical protein NTJ_04849 [Nesidiocoris tenuis]|uniref:Uncharacterized protein n=1 Tax=Nesidiocoris tenuis TaxID=355587 RepID=A0ABN7AMC5_9HEMI|nr:Hypothetical protein NTJ_04849 [Nesidiocoris tenuis]
MVEPPSQLPTNSNSALLSSSAASIRPICLFVRPVANPSRIASIHRAVQLEQRDSGVAIRRGRRALNRHFRNSCASQKVFPVTIALSVCSERKDDPSNKRSPHFILSLYATSKDTSHQILNSPAY